MNIDDNIQTILKCKITNALALLTTESQNVDNDFWSQTDKLNRRY